MAFNEFFVTVFTEASLDHFVRSQVIGLKRLHSKMRPEISGKESCDDAEQCVNPGTSKVGQPPFTEQSRKEHIKCHILPFWFIFITHVLFDIIDNFHVFFLKPTTCQTKSRTKPNFGVNFFKKSQKIKIFKFV